MVLSLPFVLAFIGSATGLLVGMLIFGDITEAIECPASGSGGGGSITSISPNTGTLGSSADGLYFENDIQTNFHVVDGIIGNGVYQEGVASSEDFGEIRFGSPSVWDFLVTTGSSELISINFWLKGDVVEDPPSDFDVPILTLNNPNETSGDPDYFFLFSRSDDLRLYIVEDGTTVNNINANTLQPPDDGQWHMITIIIDKVNIDNFHEGTICLDGSASCELETSGQLHSGTGQALTPLKIGSNIGTQNPAQDLSFAIDDFTIWEGYSLTTTDIDTLWNSGSGSSAGATGSNIEPSFQIVHITFDSSSGSETGSEQCQQAKDISWTVIGIIPVALFFSLFAIFSALGTGKQ